MKLVKFNRMMSPFNAGETRLVPDDVAVQLESDGVIETNPPDFPAKPVPAPVAAAADASRRQKLGRGRDLLGQTFLMK